MAMPALVAVGAEAIENAVADGEDLFIGVPTRRSASQFVNSLRPSLSFLFYLSSLPTPSTKRDPPP